MSASELNTSTAIVSLPTDAFAKDQANKAFIDNAKGDKLLGQAQQRMVYAVRIHDQHLMSGKRNASLLDVTLERDTDGKPTKEANAARDMFVLYFTGVADNTAKGGLSKPDFSKLDAETKLREVNAYNAKVALVKLAVEVAAYCVKHGSAWHDFNTGTNNLLVPAVMLYPRKAKPAGRIAPSIEGNKVVPAGLIELNGKSIVYTVNAKSGDHDQRKAATIAQLLRCVRPDSKPRVPGGVLSPDDNKGKAFDPKKVADVAANVDVGVLISALHDKLCGKGMTMKGELPIVQSDLTPKQWNEWSTVVLTITEAGKQPAFKQVVDGKDNVKAAYDALQSAKAA